MAYIVAIIIGYLLGCLNLAYIIGRMKKVNLKEVGSKNYGASNTVAMVGFKSGFLVFLHDLAKAYIAVVLLNFMFPDAQYAGIIAGIFAVVGHIFPFYLKFDGGKGFACYMGAMLAISPIFTLCLMGVALIFALLVDYIVAGTFLIISVAPLYLGVIQHNWIGCLLLLVTSLLILYKHKANLKNLITKNGKEMKIRSTVFKKNNRKGDK